MDASTLITRKEPAHERIATQPGLWHGPPRWLHQRRSIRTARLRHDLEVVPWPWPDDSVGEVLFKHVLEHLGRDTNVYLEIWKELYRVCQDGATIRIIVPHHRHEYFYNDPTHVRAVTADGMTLFSQRLNRQWVAQGISNSPLAIYLGIDFELVDVS